jgi:hypothetical protein
VGEEQIEGVSGQFHDPGTLSGRFAHGSFTNSSGPMPGSARSRATERHHLRSSETNWSKSTGKRAEDAAARRQSRCCSVLLPDRFGSARSRALARGWPQEEEERNRRSNEIKYKIRSLDIASP